MKTLSTSPEGFESTYALLIRSEEKQRTRIEGVVYTLLVISSVFALSQFPREAATMPAHIVRNPSAVNVAGHHDV
jgi:hypothetical protein